MCGLALAISKTKKTAGQKIWSLYKDQENRGKRGFGLLEVIDGKLSCTYRATTEGGIKKYLFRSKGGILLFHHRAPTSTDNTIETTHPFEIVHDELEYYYSIMHNGVITNHTSLHAKHEKLGYVYRSEYEEVEYHEFKDGRKVERVRKAHQYNDSECLAIEVARFLEGKSDKIDTFGAAAFIGLKIEKDTHKVVEIFYGQNYGRALCTQENNKWLSVSSETGREVERMKIFSINPTTLEITSHPMDIDTAHPPVVTTTPVSSPYHVAMHSDRQSPKTAAQNRLLMSLPNAWYTEEDIRNLALSPRFFTNPTLMRVDGETRRYSGLCRFMGQGYHERKPYKKHVAEQHSLKLLPSPTEEIEDISFEGQGETDDIDEAATAIARAGGKLDELNESWTNGVVLNYLDYTKEKERLQKVIDQNTHILESMGLTEEEITGYVEIACELVNLNY